MMGRLTILDGKRPQQAQLSSSIEAILVWVQQFAQASIMPWAMTMKSWRFWRGTISMILRIYPRCCVSFEKTASIWFRAHVDSESYGRRALEYSVVQRPSF